MAVLASAALLLSPLGSERAAAPRGDKQNGAADHAARTALPHAKARRSEAEADRDPFIPIDDGSTDAKGFGLLGSTAPSPRPLSPSQTKPAEIPQLLGTIIDSARGAVAICVLGSGPPKSVRIGGFIGNYRVDSISQGTMVAVDTAGHTVVLRLHPRS
jgi:hypothetical protein